MKKEYGKVPESIWKNLTVIPQSTASRFIFGTATKFERSIQNWDFLSGISGSDQILSGMVYM
jgi:hypothetical protein